MPATTTTGNSSYSENKYYHRPRTNTSSLTYLHDQSVSLTDSIMEPSQSQSSFPPLNENQMFNFDGDYQFSESFSTRPIPLKTESSKNQADYYYQHLNSDSVNDNTRDRHTSTNDTIHSWEQLLGETSLSDQVFADSSQSGFISPMKDSFEFQQFYSDPHRANQRTPPEEINPQDDYETIIRSRHLYHDPNPKVVRKPTLIKGPVIYNQNIILRFLKPPPVEQGPLIIQEIRPPQPPPMPPLVIRQRAAPLRSPSPIILREKPPPIPQNLGPQVITKTLPPFPPPPRSVIVEKLPALPPKPRDIIIERWIPYESAHKRRVIVQRAEEPKPCPKPRNVIITYEPAIPRIVRRYERAGIRAEDPREYVALHGKSLLSTQDLLQQLKELGITEEIFSPSMGSNQRASSIDAELNTQYFTPSTQNTPPSERLSSSNFRGSTELRTIYNNYFCPVSSNQDRVSQFTRPVTTTGVISYPNKSNLPF